jgi:hypothetical protein
MNKISKIITHIFLLLITINLGFSNIEKYEFKLEFDHDFDNEDYEIECDIKYDSRDTTFNFDKDTNGDDLEYDKSFLYDLEVDCDKDVDQILLYIYDENNDRIDKIEFEEDDKIEYTLDLVEKSQDWFEIEIIDKFDDDNYCSLNVDGDTYDYKFNDDTDSKRLTIQKNYNENIKLICDNKISKIKFTSFDSKENEVFDENTEDTNIFEFDKQVLFETNKLEIKLNYNFELKSTLECDLTKNGQSEKHKFKKSDNLKIEEKLSDNFKLSCNDKLEEIKINIFDDKNKKLIEKIFTEKRIIDYKLYLQDYLFEIKIESEFTETTYCKQLLDKNTILSKKYTYGLKQTYFNVKGTFDKIIDFECTQKIDKVTLYVYPNDKSKTFIENSKNVLFSKTFGKDSTIDYTLDKSKLNKIKIEEEKIEIEYEKKNEETSQKILNKNKDNNETDSKNSSSGDVIVNDIQESKTPIEILIIYVCLACIFLLIISLIIKKLL